MNNETQLRNIWALRLWERKGYDSAAEFKERGNCFGCGLNAGKLKVREISTGGITSTNYVHMLCNYCYADCEDLYGYSYWRWFLKRQATDTIEAMMLNRLSTVIK